MNTNFVQNIYEKFKECDNNEKLNSIFFVLMNNYYSLEKIKTDLEIIKSDIDNIKIQQRIDHISNKLSSLNI